MTEPGRQPPRLGANTRLAREPSVGLERETIQQRSAVWRHTQILTEGKIWFEDDPRSVNERRVMKTYTRASTTDYMTTGGVSAGWATANANGGIV